MERQELVELILVQVEEEGIQPFRGRVPFGLGKGTPNAIIFKITCHCGVSAMLSIDVPADSSDDKVKEMIPHLAGALDRQAKQFHRMPCDVHARISLG